jgi:hypothetical protein
MDEHHDAKDDSEFNDDDEEVHGGEWRPLKVAGCAKEKQILRCAQDDNSKKDDNSKMLRNDKYCEMIISRISD